MALGACRRGTNVKASEALRLEPVSKRCAVTSGEGPLAARDGLDSRLPATDTVALDVWLSPLPSPSLMSVKPNTRGRLLRFEDIVSESMRLDSRVALFFFGGDRTSGRTWLCRVRDKREDVEAMEEVDEAGLSAMIVRGFGEGDLASGSVIDGPQDAAIFCD
jgi:hypothetical protein